MNEETRELNKVVSRINGLYHKWNLEMGITGSRYQILIALAAEAELSQREIAMNYLLPKQTVSKEIIQMQSERLVEMKPSQQDRRAKVICLTEEGKRYADEILQPYVQLTNAVLRRMGKKKYKAFMAGLWDYADTLESEMAK